MKEGSKISLAMLLSDKEAVIHSCGCLEDTRKYLEGFGIIPGTFVTVVSEMGGNLIVSIKGSRIALSRGIAQKVMVSI